MHKDRQYLEHEDKKPFNLTGMEGDPQYIQAAAIDNVATALFEVAASIDQLAQKKEQNFVDLVAESLKINTLCPRCKSEKVDSLTDNKAVCGECKRPYIISIKAKPIKETPEIVHEEQVLPKHEEEEELPF